jgi:hypothetical protein
MGPTGGASGGVIAAGVVALGAAERLRGGVSLFRHRAITGSIARVVQPKKEPFRKG